MKALTPQEINASPELLSEIQEMKDALLEDGFKGPFAVSTNGGQTFLGVDEDGEVFEVDTKEIEVTPL